MSWEPTSSTAPPGLVRHVIAASDVADRVTVLKKNVADFADSADLAWLPAPFIGPHVNKLSRLG
jgi:hypothetical protein